MLTVLQKLNEALASVIEKDRALEQKARILEERETAVLARETDLATSVQELQKLEAELGEIKIVADTKKSLDERTAKLAQESADLKEAQEKFRITCEGEAGRLKNENEVLDRSWTELRAAEKKLEDEIQRRVLDLMAKTEK